MAGPAGIKEVALRAGVSVGTVSNVLNRPHLVRAETRERVQVAMADLAFVRNESARQLRAGSSRMLAYVFVDAENPFFVDIARGAEDACRERGFALILCNSGDDPAREEDYLNLLLEQRVRGVLVSSADVGGARLRAMPSLGVPVVLVDRGEPDPASWCSVGVDDVRGGRAATAHLLELGHRRIAFVGGSFAVPQIRDRLEGARSAVLDAGLDPSVLSTIEQDAATFAAGRQAGRAVAELPPGRRPTALFCANDLLAVGVLQSLLHGGGLRVPQDVAVVGYDDIAFASVAPVPLTSVRQPSRLIGRTAVELLLAEAEGQDRPDGPDRAGGTGQAGGTGRHVHQQVTFSPELVVRESSGPHRAG